MTLIISLRTGTGATRITFPCHQQLNLDTSGIFPVCLYNAINRPPVHSPPPINVFSPRINILSLAFTLIIY